MNFPSLEISIQSKWKSFQDHESADSGKAFLADFQKPNFKRDEKMSWSDHDLVNIRQFEESLGISRELSQLLFLHLSVHVASAADLPEKKRYESETFRIILDIVLF